QLASALNTLSASEAEYQSSLSAYQSEKAQAEAQLEAAQAEIDSGREQLNAGWTEYEENLAEVESAEEQIAAAEEQLAPAQTAYEEGAAGLAAGQSAYDAASAQVETLRSGYETAAAGVSSAQSAYDAAAAQVTQLTAEIAALNEQITSLQSQIEAAGEEEDTAYLEEQLAAAQTSLSEKQMELDTANAQAATLSQTLSEAQTTASTLQSQLTAAESALAEQKAVLDAAAETLAATAAEITAAQAELSAQKEQVAAARAALETAKEQLEATEAELAAGQAEIDSGYAALSSASAQLAAARKELDSGWASYYSSLAEYNSGLAQLSEGRQELSDALAQIEEALEAIAEAESEIEENEQKIADGWEEYEEGKEEAEQEIADGEQEIADAEEEIADAEEEIAEAEQEIADAEAELADISYPEWYVYDRSSLPDNTGYGENADRMTNIAQVFPVIFFLVAALISLTTMTRMVEEERTQIGTLKALGYGKWDIAKKYLKYAFWATMCGSVFGVLFGEKVFPWIIIKAYQIMYKYQPKILVPYNWGYGLIASGISLLCTIGAALSACYRALGTVPAELMRPPAPKQGKRVLLERLPFIWKRLSFTWKSTIRNLMRYKRRFLMTVLGIGGCMGLLLVGYGLRDSIGDVGARQYDELQTYDAFLVYDEDASAGELEELEDAVVSEDRITEWKYFYMQSMDIAGRDASGTGKQWSIYIYVPEDTENIEEYLTFRSRTSGEEYTLTDEGAIITEKIAKEFDLSVGDSLSISLDDGGIAEIPISAICENYLYHYIYLTPALYEEVFGEEPTYNSIFFCTEDGKTEEGLDTLEQIGSVLLSCDAALSITYVETLQETIEEMLSALDLVIIVLIVSAGLLAFVVLYNLNNININERRRELATLKVLGFFDGEVSAYIYRENILITIIGAGAGCLIGKALHGFIITTVEVDTCMFGRTIYPISYVYGTLFTIAFSVVVNLAMHFKLKKIDMVESLKSIE
ncbi:MAG: FtsX-like permease family protein, partial [Lachnospiraceae bacterium]|nr:FtsX-like permease family protein [Lachnospiraceae bacterium]